MGKETKQTTSRRVAEAVSMRARGVGLDPATLFDRCGVSAKRYRKIMRGARRMSLDELESLCFATESDPAELVGMAIQKRPTVAMAVTMAD